MRGVHYYPKGALCWFETNQYGDPLGSVYIAKFIPDMKLLDMPKNKRGYRQLLERQNEKKTLKETLTKSKEDTEPIAVVKPIFIKKEREKNAYKERVGRNDDSRRK